MLVVIVGPTGTGKSELSLDIAERLIAAGRPAEIVNADAMQLYRGMDIGTAKLAPAERRGVPHHLLDVLDVADEATVARYQVEARAAITGILDRGAVPILVGGSGLYVSSVVYDFQFPGTDPVLRARLEAELVDQGPGLMYDRLKAVDPGAAARIGASNGRRLVRALEVVELTGAPHTAALPGDPVYWMPAVTLGLRLPREVLTPRLDARVDRMWTAGLVEEVRALIPAGLEGGVTASRAIGYAQALGQVHGTMSQADAVEATQQLTRRYARRQVSWFKRDPHTHWIDADDADRVDQAVSHLP
ncbi:tRNA (adenosine(37)-N6)-dimethylallyltransferase MiaA [Cryobacterium sp. LW097]|uniref:tRNA (adenosine(37)-N6)-dimethylallyltransferase MiaA n=1 Tax=unclassified Cryobacterium TaxID=2649013 RepID=UPI000B4C4AED|nr:MULTISPECIES: tRNA (adenosine(37)-N6)-dimethylallyltransferase MiaA [unclassified Cryobacterium]ASD21653.1 tRNA (adenosine(37)-N6)-dimethylallyltransferase MiaA [Cryobacterium sp. LW097]TFC54926.1 tRNA (adenosine(37)-N6)-dimethylallyltransferase MiaA [Cryobacterium sp. TMB3-1-2]TFC70394.1 tRNA (adenosine(37)-N6)-dimethylallyltransferase MiaA [Cryobacterium sp. TMB3-15]TFC75735.1 tRNA (adenosine(37)-N6)-dimethylallyltransferase MiaA [Cryobacterium sp. TMB3-10]TFD45504.1 tRNA (adenosine(37)-N